MKLYGVTGWKNAGKTGLMERLITEISERGFSVSTVKHAHHNTDVDEPGRDSYRHRQAGASQVMLSTPERWALMQENRGALEPSLEKLLHHMVPVDLILIEGFKREAHAKIEAFRAENAKPPLAKQGLNIRAIAADHAVEGVDLPVFDLNDTKSVADFILAEVGL